MDSMRDIKQRIKSVGSTQQITKAMNLVSGSKLAKARRVLAETKPFYTETFRVIGNVVKNSEGIHHPFLEKREGNRALVILITSDRGLCGGYNANINKEVDKFIKDKDAEIFVVGSKGREYFRRRGGNIQKAVVGISESPTYLDAKELGELAIQKYLDGEVDSVHLAYTEFVNTLTHEPHIRRLLPVETSDLEMKSDKEEGEEKDLSIMDYEPGEEEVLSYIVPKFVNTIIYGGMVESSTCEQAARMTSMDSATENAITMIDTLTLKYNRARQGAITQEITEIVSGANALD